MTLADILKDSSYSLTQFRQDKIDRLELSISIKETRGKPTPYVHCLIRNKDIKLTPEEAVRQLFIMVLTEDYNYPLDRM